MAAEIHWSFKIVSSRASRCHSPPIAHEPATAWITLPGQRVVGGVLFTKITRAPPSAMLGVGLVWFHGETLLADQLWADGRHDLASWLSWQRRGCQAVWCTMTLATHARLQPRGWRLAQTFTRGGFLIKNYAKIHYFGGFTYNSLLVYGMRIL